MSVQPVVGILMGSDSDWEVMQACAATLKELGIPFSASISSAHRTPQRTHAFAVAAAENGYRVLICGAGAAAHLAGAVAAATNLPVIGVPLVGSDLNGMDALLATVQMPGGIPVATMAIGKPGARNAALFAAQILATTDPLLRTRLADYRTRMADAVLAKDAALQKLLRE